MQLTEPEEALLRLLSEGDDVAIDINLMENLQARGLVRKPFPRIVEGPLTLAGRMWLEERDRSNLVR